VGCPIVVAGLLVIIYARFHEKGAAAPSPTAISAYKKDFIAPICLLLTEGLPRAAMSIRRGRMCAPDVQPEAVQHLWFCVFALRGCGRRGGRDEEDIHR